MTDFEHQGEFLPEEQLELASAIAHRGIQEGLILQANVPQDVSLGPTPPVEVQERLQTGVTVVMLKLLENPSAPMDANNIAENLFDDTTVGDVFRSTGTEPYDGIGQELRAIAAAHLQVTIDKFNNNEDEQNSFQATISGARRVADSKGVSISEVFRDDTLYVEFRRTSQTPQQLVHQAISGVEKLSTEYFLEIIRTTATAMAQTELANGTITPEEFESEKDEMMHELMSDESTLLEIQNLIVILGVKARKEARFSLKRFWGEQALDYLDAGAREWVSGGNEPAAKLGGFMLKIQQQSDVIKTYCLDQGWDPNRLTMEQMQEIHASPAMQELRHQED